MRRLLLLAFLLSLPSGIASAQKATTDPRPLQDLDRNRIPTYGSVQAFLQAHPAADLQAAAVPVGYAAQIPWPVGAGAVVLDKTPGATTPVSLRIVRASNGAIRWLRGNLGHLEGGATGKQAGQVARSAQTFLAGYADLLRLRDPAAELRVQRVDRDALGYTHARFEQVYDGVPVWGRDLYVHVDAQGGVYAVNGSYEPTPAAIDTAPTLAAEAAFQAVEADLRARERWAPPSAEAARWLDLDGPQTRLVLYPDEAAGLRLAYEVTLHPNLLEWYTYLVDARDGHILNRIARHCAFWHEAPLPAAMPFTVSLTQPARKAGSTGTFFDATGTDLNGQSQALRVYRHDDNIFYKLWDLPNLNLGQSQLPDAPAGGALTISANDTDLDENAQLTHMTSNNNTWNDPAGVSAHVNMRAAYDYYQNTHGRNAIDGADQSIISIIHVTDGGDPMENAFWNGRVMAYGDGGQFFTPLAGGLDVAGHEMSHGVIQHTADLIYQFQSGALNESFADVFGAMIDRDDLLMGEDITRQNLALRDLLNPDNPQVLSQQPATMNQFRNLGADQDNGGVHINSGIPNRAAALVIQSLGRTATERIYYRALTSYLTRNSQFGDARNALEQAATDLFGSGSAEVAAVQQAFDAVGIFSTTGMGGGEGNDLPPQTGGTSLITVLLEDGSIGVVDVENVENSFTFGDPNATARVDAETGDRSQLSTPKDGERIWFINAQNQLAFVEVATGQVSVFEDLFLFQPGDLWNASISPDENFVALVSSYAFDPTLYIYNFEQIGAIPLTPETTQEGIEDETIQYPDVVSWSPNPQVPRIAVDALNEVPFGLGGGTISYWSMYEIDFSTGSIFNLIPAQPTNLSTGNITYSNTDPDLVAFNVIDEAGTWDVLVGNFEAGQIAALEIPSFTLNDVAITDAQRPTFSPDDAQLCFSSPANNALLFSDGTQLSALDVGEAVYNPRWFVRGGSGGTQNRTPTAQFVASAASGTAPLLLGFDASASSDPDGDALTYRWNFGDGSIGSGATTAHTFAFEGTFIVTLTVTDSGGLSSTATLQIQVNDTGVAVEPDDEVPEVVALHPNYPNPFNPATRLRFDLPEATEVDLTVHDVTGRLVTVLFRGTKPAGRHELAFDAADLPSGLYLVRLQAGSVVKTRSMVLLR